MTVRELIKHLETLPQDYTVAFDLHSEVKLMEKEEIEVVHATDKKLVKHHNMSDWLRTYYAHQWEGDGSLSKMTPEFVDAVVFPGN